MSYHGCPIEPSDWSDGNGEEGNCRRCEGTGEAEDEDTGIVGPCPACDGTGFVEPDWEDYRDE